MANLDPIVATLRQRRIERGLSQRAVSVRAGMAHNYVRHIEDKGNSPCLRNLKKVARVLDCDIKLEPRGLRPTADEVARHRARKESREAWWKFW